MRQDHRPDLQDEALFRPKLPAQLFDKKIIDSLVAQVSRSIQCGSFRKFGLYVYIDSAGQPTTLQVEVEFLDWVSGQWHTFKQGPFAALFWEDGDTANGIYECFVGDVLGRAVRVKLTGVGTSAGVSFTVSIGLDLWN